MSTPDLGSLRLTEKEEAAIRRLEYSQSSLIAVGAHRYGGRGGSIKNDLRTVFALIARFIVASYNDRTPALEAVDVGLTTSATVTPPAACPAATQTPAPFTIQQQGAGTITGGIDPGKRDREHFERRLRKMIEDWREAAKFYRGTRRDVEARILCNCSDELWDALREAALGNQ